MTLAVKKTRSTRSVAHATQPVPMIPHIAEVEAPDLGDYRSSREAPEMHVRRSAEAPDAGTGRPACCGSEESHGRSRS